MCRLEKKNTGGGKVSRMPPFSTLASLKCATEIHVGFDRVKRRKSTTGALISLIIMCFLGDKLKRPNSSRQLGTSPLITICRKCLKFVPIKLYRLVMDQL